MPPGGPRDLDFSHGPDAVNPVEYDFAPIARPRAMESLTTGALRGSRRAGLGYREASGLGRAAFGSGKGERSGAGDATGDGSGGDSLQVAHADYRANPAPPYPARSREREEQGTVTLHILVAADGSVKRIEIAESSGFRDLDLSALETVRKQWRFLPARRRDGHTVESWVLVPIRFALR